MRALLIGEFDASLSAVLADVLDEQGVALEEDQPTKRPDLILAIATHRDLLTWVVGTARQLGRGVPVVAITALVDDAIADDAIALGAAAVYAMEQPLSHLRVVVAHLLAAARN
jgi:hypothetical protein